MRGKNGSFARDSFADCSPKCSYYPLFYSERSRTAEWMKHLWSNTQLFFSRFSLSYYNFIHNCFSFWPFLRSFDRSICFRAYRGLIRQEIAVPMQRVWSLSHWIKALSGKQPNPTFTHSAQEPLETPEQETQLVLLALVASSRVRECPLSRNFVLLYIYHYYHYVKKLTNCPSARLKPIM
jgi:hypothetical protein